MKGSENMKNLEKLLEILENIKYGEVKIIIRDGVVTEVQKIENIRL